MELEAPKGPRSCFGPFYLLLPLGMPGMVSIYIYIYECWYIYKCVWYIYIHVDSCRREMLSSAEQLRQSGLPSFPYFIHASSAPHHGRLPSYSPEARRQEEAHFSWGSAIPPKLGVWPGLLAWRFGGVTGEISRRVLR